MQCISALFDITKVADSRWKKDDVSRIQGMSHVTYMFFWSSLGKV